MDPRIEALRSTTFFGRRLTRQQISETRGHGSEHVPR